MEESIKIIHKRRVYIVAISDIIYLRSDGAYTEVYCKNLNRLVDSRHLKIIYDLLCPKTFFRIHNSYVINLNEIKEYDRGRGGNLTMREGVLVPMAKRRKPDFLKMLNSHLLN